MLLPVLSRPLTLRGQHPEAALCGQHQRSEVGAAVLPPQSQLSVARGLCCALGRGSRVSNTPVMALFIVGNGLAVKFAMEGVIWNLPECLREGRSQN